MTSLFKTVAFGCFASVLHLSTGGVASAQPAGPAGPGRPTVSPYINLLRQGGGSPGLNYYGLVKPEINGRQSLQAVQSATAANQASIGDLLNGGGLPATGTPSQFLNHRSYFLNQGTGGVGGLNGGGSAAGGSGVGRTAVGGKR